MLIRVRERWKDRTQTTLPVSRHRKGAHGKKPHMSLNVWSFIQFPPMVLEIYTLWCFNSLPTSVVCWYLLQTIRTQIKSEKMLRLIWIQTIWHSDGIPEIIFFFKLILKKSADDICINLPYINWHMFLLLSHSYMVLYTVIKNKNVLVNIITIE